MALKSAQIKEHIVREFKIDALQNNYQTREKITDLIGEYQQGTRKPQKDGNDSKYTFTHFIIDEDNYSMFKSLVYGKNEKVMHVIEGLIVSYLKEKGKL